MPTNRVGTGLVPIEPDTKGFGSKLEAGMAAEGGPAAKRGGEKLAQAARGGFLAGAALIGKGVFDFAGFDKQMREVFTLMPDISEAAMSKMTQQVKDFSSEFGVLPKETVPALYDALGAGIPADNVFTFLETAQKLAKGGVTDLATSVDGLSSIVNAYGMDVITAEQASDTLFTTVKLGKGTVDDISRSLFNVTPVAAAFGVSFDEVGAAIATLTASGVPASQSTTMIRQAIAELGKEGTKASKTFEDLSGKSFGDFIAAGGTMDEALRMMRAEADETGTSIIDMFGSIEAGSAALTLTGGATNTEFLKQMQDDAGATDEAFERMNVGLSATMDRLKARFSVALINIGEAIAPSILVAGEMVADLLDLFNLLPGPMQAAGVLFGTLTLGMIAFAKPILNAITLFSKLGKVFTLLAANPWVIVLAGLVAITILIIKNWEEVSAFLGETWSVLQSAGKAAADGIATAWEASSAFVVGAFNALAQTAQAVMTAIGISVQTMASVVTSTFSTIVGVVAGAWSSVMSLTSAAWSTVTSIVTSAAGGIVSFLTGIPNAIIGAFSTLANAISAPFVAAFGAIKATWNATVGGFGFEVPGWIPFVGGNSFTIPSMATGGVLLSPQLFIGGDYPGARGNPEIVAPQNIIRETVIQAIRQTQPATPADGAPARIPPTVIHIEKMIVRNDEDIERIARALDRRQRREERAQGRPRVRTA